jgi:hypothetical protein
MLISTLAMVHREKGLREDLLLLLGRKPEACIREVIYDLRRGAALQAECFPVFVAAWCDAQSVRRN